MTSRERVLVALRHQQPDRTPIDFGGMRSTGATAIAYNRLKKYLGVAGGETRVYDVVQQLAQPEDEILDLFEVDVIDLGRAFLTEPEDWKPWTLPDGSPAKIPTWFCPEPDGKGGWVARAEDGTIIGRMPAGVEYFSQAFWPLAETHDLRELERLDEHKKKVTWMALPSPPWHLRLPTSPPPPLPAGEGSGAGDAPEDDWALLARRANELYESTDRAIMAAFGGNLLEGGQFLCGIARFLEDLAGDRRWAEALLDKLVEGYMAALPKFLEAVGPYIQIIQMGDDLGTQTGLQISPRMYRDLFKPRHRHIYGYIRDHFDGFLFLHSCGSLREIIPDLIDVGVQVINPVQTNAAGMDPAELKREFGRDLSFWGGGCETQGVLAHGTPEQVRTQVRERLRIFGEGGGYVFNQIHNVLSNVPPENVVAMFEAAKEYR
jgi:uroporphyrinogen decarboxylase